MLNRFFIAIIILALIGGGIWGFLYFKEIQTPVSKAITAIPKDAAIIFESRRSPFSWNIISKNSIIWQDLLQSEVFAILDRKINTVDSLLRTDTVFYNAIGDQSLFISAHMSGVHTFDFLYTINLPTGISEEELTGFIKKASGFSTITERFYDVVKIWQLKTDSKILSFSYNKGIFIASFSPLLVEQSIRQLHTGSSLLNDPNFEKVVNTTGNRVQGNVFINYKAFPTLINLFTAPDVKKDVNLLLNFANWTALDVKFKPNALMLNGFTYSNDSTNNYLNIFQKQKAQKIEITKVLPSNTAYMMFFGVSNFKSYHRDYKSFLENSNKLFAYDNLVKSFNTTFNTNIEEEFYQWVGNEFALVITEPPDTGYAKNSFAILKANNREKALAMIKQFASGNEIKAESKPKEKETKKSKNKKNKNNKPAEEPELPSIYHLKTQQLPSVVLGNLFLGFKGTYCTIIEDYVVFSSHPDGLSEFSRRFSVGKTLKSDRYYDEFADNLGSEANIYLYSNIARSTAIYQKNLQPGYAKDIEFRLELFRKFEAAAIQYSSDNGLFYNNLYVKHNPVYKQENKSLWETELEAPVSMKPKVVINHTNMSKEIFVQDDDKNIYLISNSGKILWKRELNEKIMSDIFQVDVRKNGKLQYLFNTESKIYLLDRNGKDVDMFPLQLKSKASNELVVFDYENNREYRMMIACEDKMIYNYSVTGTTVAGWQFEPMQGIITQPVQHFVINGKDYLLAVDQTGNVKLFDRKGKSIKELNEKFPVHKNSIYLEIGKTLDKSRMVSTDSTGVIHYFYFEDKVETLKINGFSQNHFFELKDLNNDKSRELIFVEENKVEVYGQDKSLQFSYEFKGPIGLKPQYFLFPDNKGRIGITSNETNEIFLFHHDGSLVKGFPYAGSTQFSISDINEDKQFNIITGSKDKKVYCYTLESSN